VASRRSKVFHRPECKWVKETEKSEYLGDLAIRMAEKKERLTYEK
jgi:hypothetical protein